MNVFRVNPSAGAVCWIKVSAALGKLYPGGCNFHSSRMRIVSKLNSPISGAHAVETRRIEEQHHTRYIMFMMVELMCGLVSVLPFFCLFLVFVCARQRYSRKFPGTT